MNALRIITVIVLLTFLSTQNVFAQNNPPLIRFGLIADIQYCSCATQGNRYYQNSLIKLDSCIADLNQQKVDFTINLGDLIDRKSTDLDSIIIRLKKSDAKIYNTTGNHDYHGVTNNKALFKKLNMPAEYYSFEKDNWLFIILNTNEVASYANVQETYKEKELATMLAYIKAENKNNGQEWNGGISSKQKKWLEKLLAKAQKKNKKVMLFSHHPFYPEFGLTVLNDYEILNIINKYSCVKAIFAGHHHSGEFAYYNNIPAITIEGMVETETENAYGIVEIYPNKLLLKGIGRTISREFNF